MLTGQLLDKRLDPAGPHWGVTAVVRGADYAATLRAKHGPEVGVSYHQRLAPGSRFSLGGELMLSRPAMLDTLKAAAASASSSGAAAAGTDSSSALKPVEWSAGGAYDAGMNKVSGAGRMCVLAPRGRPNG